MGRPHYYLYFAGFDGKTEQIGVATSNDLYQWQVSTQPIIPVGKPGEWDSSQTSNPCVLYENQCFRMWYQGVDDDGRYRLGYAESSDGLIWQKQPEVIFERPGIGESHKVPKREGYHQPLVLSLDDSYRMYFLDHRQGLGYIRLAESKDGLGWEVHPDDCLAPEKPWEVRGLHYPWVIRETNHYVMWYTSEADHTRWYLNRAISEDGINWQRDPVDRPVIDIRLPRTVSRGHYWLPRKLLRYFPNYLHPAFRASGRKRVRLPQGIWGRGMIWLHDRIIYPLRAKRYISFNNSSIHRQPDGSYLMFFQAFTENSDLAIGTATSPDGIGWQAQHMDILRKPIQERSIEWCSVFDGDPHLLIWEE
jgi:predicted GH43/DUF377 family glycosyl hydrolase